VRPRRLRPGRDGAEGTPQADSRRRTTGPGGWKAWAGYHDVHSYPQAEHLPGLVIYRLDGPLFFANATTFRDEVRKLAKADPPPTWIVIAAEPMTDVDTTASDVLEELDEALNDQGISLVFAELTNGTAPPHGFRAGS
jgi:MFS superfamily sulfate permease-like transporter